MKRFKQLLSLTLPLFTACAIEDTPTLEEDTLEIQGPDTQPASQFALDRAVDLPGCTATKISAHFALTAAHCQSSVGQIVRFYSTGPDADTSTRARVKAVHIRPGVDLTQCNVNASDVNCDDSNGKWSDVAVLELETTTGGSETDLEGKQATLAWVYPGYGYDGMKVGAGSHSGISNSDGTLLQYPDETTSDDDNDGMFDTRDATTNPGDSGGPFYYQSRILGTLVGTRTEGLNSFNQYTSVPEHLHWILSKIGYKWRGQAPQASTLYSGGIVQTLLTTEAICQYACEKTSSCEAYGFLTSAPPSSPNCNLYTDISSVNTSAGLWRSALKHGSKHSNANDVVGFVRADNVNTVVHKATNGNIHVLHLANGTWNLTAVNPSAVVSSNLSVYKRTENVDAIVFRNSANHIIQILRTSTGWNDEADLTELAGGELAAGTPTAYVRADGVNAVVYRGATTGHIWELRRGSVNWIATDLTAEAGSSSVASSDPIANARADGYSSVVFRSGTAVRELYRAAGGTWHIGTPSALAGAPDATDRPFTYTKRDGTTAIIYRQASTGQIVELTLSGSTWSFQHLSSNATGAPVAYVRADAVDAVLFRNLSNEIVQVTGATTNLTTFTGAPDTATNPMAYVRSDGYNSVLFEDGSNNVREFFVKKGGTWSDGNISAVADETP